jgi:hypothetical protein
MHFRPLAIFGPSLLVTFGPIRLMGEVLVSHLSVLVFNFVLLSEIMIYLYFFLCCLKLRLNV